MFGFDIKALAGYQKPAKASRSKPGIFTLLFVCPIPRDTCRSVSKLSSASTVFANSQEVPFNRGNNAAFCVICCLPPGFRKDPLGHKLALRQCRRFLTFLPKT